MRQVWRLRAWSLVRPAIRRRPGPACALERLPPGSRCSAESAAAAALALAGTAQSLRCEARPERTVRVHYLRPDADEVPLLESLAPAEPLVELSWGDALPADAEALQVLITRLPEAWELDALRLEALIVPFAGPTGKTRSLIQQRPQIALHNCHFNAASTAELALALFLAATKRVGELDAQFRNEICQGIPWTAGWQSPAMDCPTLRGRGAVVLGHGAVGSRIAAVLQALGMDVHVVRRRAELGEGGLATHTPSELPELLPEAFAVFVCLPGTRETAGLLGRTELRSLPRGAVLVNVGRGSVVDEAAAFEALRDGHLGAAGLDVWYNYPMLPGQGMGQGTEQILAPSQFPFHELPNVVMSPHRGQSSDSKARDRVRELLQMLSTRARTGRLPNRFDLEAGY